jgi:hypothetical protein
MKCYNCGGEHACRETCPGYFATCEAGDYEAFQKELAQSADDWEAIRKAAGTVRPSK